MVKIHSSRLNLLRVQRVRQIRKVGRGVEVVANVMAILAGLSLVSAPVLHSLPAVTLAGVLGLGYIVAMMLAMLLQSVE